MSRKVLKNWGGPLSHIFQFEAAPNTSKNSWSHPFFSPTSPLPLLMTGPLDISLRTQTWVSEMTSGFEDYSHISIRNEVMWHQNACFYADF
jgi:hypothetical protein